MKTIHLLSLLLALILFLGIAPTARTLEPLNRLNAIDATEQLPFDLTARVPTEWQGRLFDAISVLSAPSAIQSTASDWQIECVDCPRQFNNMTDRSLRLDAEGHPHIAYGGDHLYYAWNDGIDWHIETVDNSQWVGEYASLALDGMGRTHISYYDWSNRDLKYAWYDGMAH